MTQYTKTLKPSFKEAALDPTNDLWGGIDNWMSSTERLIRNGYPIPSTVDIDSSNGVQVGTDYNQIHMRIQSATSGNSNITVNPQITYGVDGQNITLEGSHDTKTVTIKNGNGVVLDGGTDCVLKKHNTLSLCYNAIDKVWIEKSRTNVS